MTDDLRPSWQQRLADEAGYLTLDAERRHQEAQAMADHPELFKPRDHGDQLVTEARRWADEHVLTFEQKLALAEAHYQADKALSLDQIAYEVGEINRKLGAS